MFCIKIAESNKVLAKSFKANLFMNILNPYTLCFIQFYNYVLF